MTSEQDHDVDVAGAGLQGCPILVVEDESMIAAEINHTLSNAGVETVGPVVTVGADIRLIAIEGWIDGALLDVNLGREPVWPVVDILLARGIPLQLATGHDVSAVPKAYARLHSCEKPICGCHIVRAVARAMTETPYR